MKEKFNMKLSKDNKGHYEWTPEAESFFRGAYPISFNTDLSRLFSISRRTVERKAKEFGLIKSLKFIKTRDEEISFRIQEGMFASSKRKYNKKTIKK